MAELTRTVRRTIAAAEADGFDDGEQQMLRVFFDVAGGCPGRRDLITLAVLLPRIALGQRTRIYVRTPSGGWRLERGLRPPQSPTEDAPTEDAPLVETPLAAESPAAGAFAPPPTPLAAEPAAAMPFAAGGEFFAPIRSGGAAEGLDRGPTDAVLGWLAVAGGAGLPERRRLFFTRYADRIGFQLRIREVREKNEEHLRFIRTLTADIGHNVIAPNMIMKLFLNHLGRSLKELERLTAEAPADVPEGFLEDLDRLQRRLRSQFAELTRHYEFTSLFLETLLRRRHFEEGRYVLEKRLVNLRKQVVEPQVERYRPRLAERGVAIDLSMGGIPDKPVLLMADLGLIAQVYANLFSNAVKYARPTPDPQGRPRTFMAYGWEILPEAFGPERPGVKLNVFTTGEHIPEAERPGLFTPGFRASSRGREEGTGQGLAFVRQVVDLHGGRVGYEPRPSGNNFFIILPLGAGAGTPAPRR